MRNINVVIMDIFLIFHIIIFEIWKITEIYQVRAREIEPPRKSRELAKIASEPQRAAFRIPLGSEPSFGGARSRVGGRVG